MFPNAGTFAATSSMDVADTDVIVPTNCPVLSNTESPTINLVVASTVSTVIVVLAPAFIAPLTRTPVASSNSKVATSVTSFDVSL